MGLEDWDKRASTVPLYSYTPVFRAIRIQYSNVFQTSVIHARKYFHNHAAASNDARSVSVSG